MNLPQAISPTWHSYFVSELKIIANKLGEEEKVLMELTDEIGFGQFGREEHVLDYDDGNTLRTEP